MDKAEDNTAMVYIAFVSYTEVYYITWQRVGEAEAQKRDALLSLWLVKRVESTPTLSRLAGAFKAKYQMSFADAWIAAVAKETDAVLVHKDPEFESIETEIHVLKLPYK